MSLDKPLFVFSFLIVALAIAGCSYEDPASTAASYAGVKDASDTSGDDGGNDRGSPAGVPDSIVETAEPYPGPTPEPTPEPTPDPADDDVPIPDQEYDALRCVVPDPEGLGGGVMFGGGANEGTMVVYVYDDADCSPVSSAFVIAGTDAATAFTDVNGRAELAVDPGLKLVSVVGTGFSPWSYAADARVMMFRLRPFDREFPITDSDEGVFRVDGDDLALDNPQNLGGFFDAPAYAGFLLPGVSRSTAMSSVYRGIETNATFPIEWLYGGEHLPEETIGATTNFYLPYVNLVIDIPDIVTWGFWGGNETYRVPIVDGATTVPISSFLLSIDVAKALDLATFMQVVYIFVEGGDLEEVFTAVIKPLFNDCLRFPYVATAPNWTVGDSPDFDLTRVDAETNAVEVSIANHAVDRDYLLALAAEVPNRSLVPLSFGVATNGFARLGSASLADADYLAVAGRTGMLQGDPYTQTLSAVVRYAQNLGDWRDGLVIDDADFPPEFDMAVTDYDDYTGTFKWAFAGDAADMDYVLISSRRSWSDQFDRYYGIFPADAGEVTVPFGSLGFYENWIDTVTAVAVDLPEDIEAGFDPTRLFGYDNARYSIWCEEPLFTETLYQLLGFIDW